MRHFSEIVRRQYLGAISLVLVLAGGVYAATGNPVLLGRVNQAGSRTLIQNTGNGPALQLKSSKTAPPLRVNSTKRVPGLNASFLRGWAPKAFAAAGSSYTKAQSDARYLAAGEAYTKSQADAKFAEDGASYTKAESNARYPLASNVYTKAEADGIFVATGGPVLLAVDFEFDALNQELLLNRSVHVPGPGKLIVSVDGTCHVSNTSKASIAINAVKTSSVSNYFGPGEGTTLLYTGCHHAIEIDVTGAGSVDVSASVNLTAAAAVHNVTAEVYFIPG